MNLRGTFLVSALLSAIASACAHEQAPPPESTVHLDAPPIGDAGATPPAPTGPFAKIDIPVGDGKCPQPVHPAYCNFRCRQFQERQSSHHAQRIEEPARYALGTCGSFKAFAEEGKDGNGLIELFDDDGALVASEYAKSTGGDGCTTFLINGRSTGVTCVPKLEWHPAEVH